MSVTIDEIHAEVEPPTAPGTPPAATGASAPEPEMELRRLNILLRRRAVRAARLEAD